MRWEWICIECPRQKTCNRKWQEECGVINEDREVLITE